MTDLAYQAMAANLVEALTEPRKSARRILEIEPSFADCAMMAVGGFAVQGLAGEFIGLLGAADTGGGGVAALLAQVVMQLLLFAALAWGIWIVGKQFGGRADQSQSMAMAGWHALVTAFLSPLALLGMSAAQDGSPLPGLFLLLAPLTMGYSIWIFACFVAEAHGFTRMTPVILASIGGMFALGVLSLVLAGLLLGPLGAV